ATDDVPIASCVLPLSRCRRPQSIAPIVRRTVVFSDRDLVATIAPIECLIRVVVGRMTESFVGDIDQVGLPAGIVFQPLPWDGQMLASHSEKAAETQDRVSDLPADLVDHQALDVADLFAARPAHRRAFDPVARDQAVWS